LNRGAYSNIGWRKEKQNIFFLTARGYFISSFSTHERKGIAFGGQEGMSIINLFFGRPTYVRDHSAI